MYKVVSCGSSVPQVKESNDFRLFFKGGVKAIYRQFIQEGDSSGFEPLGVQDKVSRLDDNVRGNKLEMAASAFEMYVDDVLEKLSVSGEFIFENSDMDTFAERITKWIHFYDYSNTDLSVVFKENHFREVLQLLNNSDEHALFWFSKHIQDLPRYDIDRDDVDSLSNSQRALIILDFLYNRDNPTVFSQNKDPLTSLKELFHLIRLNENRYGFELNTSLFNCILEKATYHQGVDVLQASGDLLLNYIKDTLSTRGTHFKFNKEKDLEPFQWIMEHLSFDQRKELKCFFGDEDVVKNDTCHTLFENFIRVECDDLIKWVNTYNNLKIPNHGTEDSVLLALLYPEKKLYSTSIFYEFADPSFIKAQMISAHTLFERVYPDKDVESVDDLIARTLVNCVGYYKARPSSSIQPIEQALKFLRKGDEDFQRRMLLVLKDDLGALLKCFSEDFGKLSISAQFIVYVHLSQDVIDRDPDFLPSLFRDVMCPQVEAVVSNPIMAARAGYLLHYLFMEGRAGSLNFNVVSRHFPSLLSGLEEGERNSLISEQKDLFQAYLKEKISRYIEHEEEINCDAIQAFLSSLPFEVVYDYMASTEIQFFYGQEFGVDLDKMLCGALFSARSNRRSDDDHLRSLVLEYSFRYSLYNEVLPKDFLNLEILGWLYSSENPREIGVQMMKAYDHHSKVNSSAHSSLESFSHWFARIVNGQDKKGFFGMMLCVEPFNSLDKELIFEKVEDRLVNVQSLSLVKLFPEYLQYRFIKTFFQSLWEYQGRRQEGSSPPLVVNRERFKSNEDHIKEIFGQIGALSAVKDMDKKPMYLKVNFEGESSLDLGGPMKEFVSLMGEMLIEDRVSFQKEMLDTFKGIYLGLSLLYNVPVDRQFFERHRISLSDLFFDHLDTRKEADIIELVQGDKNERYVIKKDQGTPAQGKRMPTPMKEGLSELGLIDFQDERDSTKEDFQTPKGSPVKEQGSPHRIHSHIKSNLQESVKDILEGFNSIVRGFISWVDENRVGNKINYSPVTDDEIFSVFFREKTLDIAETEFKVGQSENTVSRDEYDRMLIFFKDFLKEYKEDMTVLKSFYTFCTGAPQSKGDIFIRVFIPSSDSLRPYPTASTCGRTISTPFIEDYDDFKGRLLEAIQVKDFGRV